MRFHLKNNQTTKRKHHTTSEFISSDLSFEEKHLKKKLKNETTKMKLYTTSEYMSTFEKKISAQKRNFTQLANNRI